MRPRSVGPARWVARTAASGTSASRVPRSVRLLVLGDWGRGGLVLVPAFVSLQRSQKLAAVQ